MTEKATIEVPCTDPDCDGKSHIHLPRCSTCDHAATLEQMETLVEKMKARMVGQVVRRLDGEKVDKTSGRHKNKTT